MAETAEFFDSYMPKKLTDKPDLIKTNAIFRFDIADAGTWIIDLKNPPGAVRACEATEAADCVITVAKADWERVLDNPALAMQLFMTGKLKASNIGLAMALQKILG